ncbi:CatB-related O-acetyltransferase [uncultured Bacteroides sp.]|nr:CatB-related O-acetyltransferase [uncultured Bacteroides sp.]
MFGIKNTIKKYLLMFRNDHLRIANGVLVWGNISFGKNCELNDRVVFADSSLGDYSYVNFNSIVTFTTIGKFCSIGPNCVIGLGNHPTRTLVSTSSCFYTKGEFMDRLCYEGNTPVVIGNDVWIGANVTIVNGVTIGDGAIVAANSVVNKSIPPYTVYGGVPAHFIRKRFADSEIDVLQKIQWWNKSREWIKQHAGLFLDVRKFVEVNSNTRQ